MQSKQTTKNKIDSFQKKWCNAFKPKKHDYYVLKLFLISFQFSKDARRNA